MDPSTCAVFLRSVQSSALRSLFEVLRDVIHDCNLVCDQDGVRIMTVDGSHVALVYVRLDASAFEVYHCPQEIQLGCNMTNLYRMLRSASNNDTVAMYVKADSLTDLVIEVTNADRRSTSKFILKLLDIDPEVLTVPDIQYESTLTLPSNYFARLCKEMAGISDTISITSKDHKLILACEGDYASQETTIEDNLGMIEPPADGQVVTGAYLIKFLVLFNKAFVLCNTVELHMKNGWPLVLRRVLVLAGMSLGMGLLLLAGMTICLMRVL